MFRFLVRQRVPLVFLTLLVLVFWARPRPWEYGLGVLVMGLGQALRIWAAGIIAKGRELAVTGPYAYVRHPLYLGTLLIVLGCCTMSGRWFSFPIALGLFALTYWPTIVEEEAALRKQFGASYVNYCACTPRLWPRLRRPSQFPSAFTWRQVWHNHEYDSMICVGLALLAYGLRLWQ
ncbi:MAG TPA: isoprenylcysteine carboxylmethyltransferase family protein [Armatimonadetes bacterium]|nr:isoprenylcysteine carboxylmethyltransferase family protein [Armatimonadota bacterium]